MKERETQNNFAERLEALQRERSECAFEIAKWQARAEQLVREEERLRCQAATHFDRPLSVRRDWLLANLTRRANGAGLSPQGLDRLLNNPAKGFPRPRYGIDSDPYWLLDEVEQWMMERENGQESVGRRVG